MNNNLMNAREIPEGESCTNCSFGHHYYFNEDDDVGITYCGLFDTDVEKYVYKLKECLEKFPYGGMVLAIAKKKQEK